jgi:hypothetical protein
LREMVRRSPTTAELPAGFALLLAYRVTFPCP